MPSLKRNIISQARRGSSGLGTAARGDNSGRNIHAQAPCGSDRPLSSEPPRLACYPGRYPERKFVIPISAGMTPAWSRFGAYA
jgi:hypothetical protein